MRRVRVPTFRSLRGRLGLRGRVILTFALGAALLSLALSTAVFATSREYLVGQRERSAERQTASHADFVRSVLYSSDTKPALVLQALDIPVGTTLFLDQNGKWSASDPAVAFIPSAIPAELQESGTDGGSATMYITVAGNPYIGSRMVLNDAGDILYELSPVLELQSTLRILRITLFSWALVTTAAGAAMGFWASRRVLRPLHELAGTAARISGGDLDTRLARSQDRDLDTITTSFNAMVDSLQRRIDHERRFFGDVSHELRTPLTTLVTSVSVLERQRRDLPERSVRALDLISAELDHTRRLLDDLLALARSEAGLHPGDLEPVSVETLLSHTLTRSKRSADLLTVATEDRVAARKLSLERALVNLMDNADRHGGGLVAVTVRRDGEFVAIDVDDAGPGVAPEDRERIFERFTTGRPARRTAGGSGTGLGLALVAETVSAHGGTVTCGDRPGGGARFTLRLPRLRSRRLS
ncbi:HAMP domain-containing sensor histidine kinase [Rhodococcus gannanensis]|uniref:histidine kinase n=1 Tax=Rhodococcus gannanensis TaxID=1960308 RepID=A0ABW4NYQ0_9NOCA